jgi:hypothetical protein
MTLLRVPIRIRIATTHAPFDAAPHQRPIQGRKISPGSLSNPEFSQAKSNLMARGIFRPCSGYCI